MRINGLQNKFEMFQDFYYEVKGIQISYKEALRLYALMDRATKNSFLKYCADKVDYEIIYEKDECGNFLLDDNGDKIRHNAAPFVTTNAYNLKHDVKLEETGETKKVKRKEKQPDGSIKYVEKEVKCYTSNLTELNKHFIGTKSSIEAYAVRNGLKLDPVWGKYSPEEIIQMENEGVNIPQDIIDIAHSIIESSGANYEGGEDEEGTGETTTEKEPFLELVPKAQKHIEKCEEKREKIDDKIQDMLGETAKNKKSFLESRQSKLDELKEYEEKIREWRHLQDKINNGEELTDSEARKYAQITGMLQEKNHKSSDFTMDKNKIAMSLNDINILAVLGEKLADETIEIADTLADYTSEANYKSTRDTVTQEMGFLRAIVAMANGKAVAQEASKIGNETKEYTEQTSGSVNDIASVLGVESMLANPNSGECEATEETGEMKTAETQASEGTDAGAGNVPDTDNNAEDKNAAEQKNTTQEDDFIVNDENVLGLIKDAGEINNDLLNEVKTSAQNLKMSADDKDFAESAEKLVAKMVKEYKEEEARRQQEISTKEQEIKQAQEKIDELQGGKEAEELAEQFGVENNDEQTPENKKEIETNKQIIEQNTSAIEALKAEQAQDTETFKAAVAPQKSQIAKALPEEMEALENDTKYKDEIIPEDVEKLAFTGANGGTLFKMGKYRITVGLEYLAAGMFVPPLRVLGMWHIARGGISAAIGAEAQAAAKTPLPEVALKSVDASTANEEVAINGMNSIDAQISEITGEQTEAEKYESANADENDDANNEVTETTEEQTVEGSEGQPVVENNNESVTGGAAQISESDAKAVEETPADEDSKTVKNVKESEEKQKTSETNPEKAIENDDEIKKETKTSGKSAKSEKKQDMDTDKAQDTVDDIAADGEETGKDSEKVLKDTDKDEKQLEKETKKLMKQMKSDEKEIIRMTKESERAAKKQEELLVRYEELVAENEKIEAEEQQKQTTAPAGQSQEQTGTQGGASNGFKMTDSSQTSTADNVKKLSDNDQQITMLSGEFKVLGSKINRNRTRVVRLQKVTKVNNKKFEKKSKIRQTKIKEAEKKEQDKQKKLAKQLGIVGVQENLFSMTASVGSIMMMSVWPATVAAGTVLFNIGTYGVATCGVTKSIINLANGNAMGALMGLGTAAISVAGAMVGAGGAANNVMGAVSAGLSIVASSAEMVNNVRAIQGKEANGLMSKISVVAGAASAVTNIASGLMKTRVTDLATKSVSYADSAFKSASSFGKVTQIASAVGQTMSSASQIMTEFNLADENTAQMIGTIGSAISTISSVAQLASSKKSNEENKEGSDNNSNKDKAKVGSTDENGKVKSKDADGTIHYEDGTVKKPDGTVQYPDGTSKKNGVYYTKDGKVDKARNKLAAAKAKADKKEQDKKLKEQQKAEKAQKKAEEKQKKAEAKQRKSKAEQNKSTQPDEQPKQAKTDKPLEEMSSEELVQTTREADAQQKQGGIVGGENGFVSGTVNVTNADTVQNAEMRNAVEQSAQSTQQLEALEAKNNTQEHQELLASQGEAEEPGKIKPVELEKLGSISETQEQMRERLFGPEAQEKMKIQMEEIAKKVQEQQLAEYKANKESNRKDTVHDILNAGGTLLTVVGAALQGGEDATDTKQKKFAGSGKEYLKGSPYKNAVSYHANNDNRQDDEQHKRRFKRFARV